MKKYIYDIKPPIKNRCVRCGVYIKSWGYILSSGLHCKNCREIGLLIQKMSFDSRMFKIPLWNGVEIIN